MIQCRWCPVTAVSEEQLGRHVQLRHARKEFRLDPSLMTQQEIDRRGRVVIDPCYVCHHNRSAHVLEGVFAFEVHGERHDREILDACIACRCLEFTSPPEPEDKADGARCCAYDRPHVVGYGSGVPLGMHWVRHVASKEIDVDDIPF